MWMTREVVTVSPRTLVADAAVLMAREHIRCLPVLESHDGEPQLVGIITAADVLHAFPPHVNPFAAEPPDAGSAPATVASIMRRVFDAAAPDTPIEEVAAVMVDHKIAALPVLRDGRVVGIITESDLFRAFVALVACPGAGARVTFDMSRGEDVFDMISQAAKRDGLRVRSLVSTREGNRPVCVVWITGAGVQAFLDDLWGSGHPVVNVVRFPSSGGPAVSQQAGDAKRG